MEFSKSKNNERQGTRIKILIVQVHIAKCTVVLVKSVCLTVKEYYHQQIIVLILSLIFVFNIRASMDFVLYRMPSKGST